MGHWESRIAIKALVFRGVSGGFVMRGVFFLFAVFYNLWHCFP